MINILRPFMCSLYEKIGHLNSMPENQAQMKATWTETQLLHSSWSCMQMVTIMMMMMMMMIQKLSLLFTTVV